MEQKQQGQLEGMSKFTPENILANFEKSRIVADNRFADLYSDFENDMQRAKDLRDVYNNELNPDKVGSIGEALIFTCLSEGALGKSITARGTNDYDDLFHGADILIESKAKQQRDPIVSTIDVTLSQPDINRQRNTLIENESTFEAGFKKKLERVKRHVLMLSKLSDNESVELSAWMQRGGLREKRGPHNEAKFKDAEKFMLLKYYKNPATSDNPDEPHFIVSGPQIIVSVDNSFVNKILSQEGEVQHKAIDELNNLLQLEVPISVLALNKYVEKVALQAQKEGKGTNIFFASYRAACKAWVGTFFENEEYAFRIQKAIEVSKSNPATRSQMSYVNKTLEETFGIKIFE